MSAEAVAADEPRFHLTVAPRFALPCDFERRLERDGGVRFDGERVHPLGDWRPLDPAELTAVVGPSPAPDAVLSPTELGLIQLPERLRAAWWAEAEQSGATDAASGRFDAIFAEVVEFLRFKRLPLPDEVRVQVAVSAPGLPSTRVGPTGALEGLGLGAPVACINLGDEPGFVVLLELPPAALVRRLVTARSDAPGRLSPPALVRRFFETFPRQPLLRIRLEPGEGLWLSPLGVVHDGWTEGKTDLDVMLRVSPEGPPT